VSVAGSRRQTAGSTKLIRLARVLFLLPAACFLLSLTCSRQTSFLERSVVVNGRIYKYRVWLPPHYSKVHRWPVVLYLHGSAERGDDNVRQLSNGLPVALPKYSDRYKTVVVIPQCAYGQEWYGDQETQALAALDKSIVEFRGDRRRLYLTGISLGGAGTWYMARHRRWAAVIPVCGEVSRQPNDPFPSDPPPDLARIVGSPDPFGTLADAIGNTPVWMFHGSEDREIPVTQSRAMFAAFRARGWNARYTEYKGIGHQIWDETYADEELVHWMLKQRR